MRNRIVLYQGEKRELLITVLGDDGQPHDLTGNRVEWVAVSMGERIEKSTDPDDGITVVDAEGGKISIRMEPADTQTPGRYRVEVRVFGSELIVTVLDSSLIIVPSLFV